MEDDVIDGRARSGEMSEGTPTTKVSPQDVPPGVWQQRPVRGHRPHHVPVLGPVLLITAGSVFLLNNLGVLPWSLWGQVWRLWPIIPIAIGLDMIVGRRSPSLAVILVLGVIAAGVGILYNNGSFEPEVEAGPTSLNVPLEGATTANVTLDFGAGDLSLSSLNREARQLATGTLENSGSRAPNIESDLDDGTLELEVKQRSEGFGSWFGRNHKRANWNVKLSPMVPLNLDVNAGASKVNLDLTELQVSSLKLDVGASDTTVIFQTNGPNTNVDIDAGAAHLRLVIPEGVATRMDVSSAVSSVNMPENRFTKTGNTYETQGYSTAERKLNIKLDAGAATIDVESR